MYRRQVLPFKEAIGILGNILNENTYPVLDFESALQKLMAWINEEEKVYFEVYEGDISQKVYDTDTIHEIEYYGIGTAYPKGRNYVKNLCRAIEKTTYWKNVKDSEARAEVMQAIGLVNLSIQLGKVNSASLAMQRVVESMEEVQDITALINEWEYSIELVDGKIYPKMLASCIRLVNCMNIYKDYVDEILQQAKIHYEILLTDSETVRDEKINQCINGIIGALFEEIVPRGTYIDSGSEWDTAQCTLSKEAKCYTLEYSWGDWKQYDLTTLQCIATCEEEEDEV